MLVVVDLSSAVRGRKAYVISFATAVMAGFFPAFLQSLENSQNLNSVILFHGYFY